MGQSSCYRYVGGVEWRDISDSLTIQSRSGITYFAIDPPSCYSTRDEVTEALAISDIKEFRVGPIPLDEMPDWDVVPPRTVGPVQLRSGAWVPGGGTEAATSHPVRVFGRLRLR